MTTKTEERERGLFAVEVELPNNDDCAYAAAGFVAPDKIRRMKVRAIVDSGTMMMVVPEVVVRELGLETRGAAKACYANGQTANRPIARTISLRFGGRESVFDAVVEPSRNSALIGAIVMEVLDFVIDCGRQQLVPRDPDQIITEVE